MIGVHYHDMFGSCRGGVDYVVFFVVDDYFVVVFFFSWFLLLSISLVLVANNFEK